jgi:2-polyprenyl-3-methyl-5-hydroxy-6-metoxy-1,4-benzoquinol methylase
MTSEKISQYSTKTPEYFLGARVDFVSRLPINYTAKILEIGCSSGGTGALALSEGKCGSYTGIDIMPQAVEIAKTKLSKVILTDLDTNFPNIEHQQFDALIASEIFEHLRDPWTVLAKLMPLLKPGAIVLASSPNIAHKNVINNLKKGDFNYEDMGVMDRTHLRWFTPNSFQELFSDAGLIVTDLFPISPLKIRHKLIAKFLPNGQKTFWRQICIEARKP